MVQLTNTVRENKEEQVYKYVAKILLLYVVHIFFAKRVLFCTISYTIYHGICV